MINMEKKEFAAVVGIDWATERHAVCIHDRCTGLWSQRWLENTAEALHGFAREMTETYSTGLVGVCIEQSRGSVISALCEYPHIVLYPINPLQLKRYREVVGVSAGKDDQSDARLHVEMLDTFQDKIRPLAKDSEAIRRLRYLCEQRRSLVDERSRLGLRLSEKLKTYFPQAVQLAGTVLTSKMALDFLSKWDCLEKVQRARPETLRKFYLTHHSYSEELLNKRLELIAQSEPLTNDSCLIETAALFVQCLVQQLKALLPQIDAHEAAIAQAATKCEEVAIFASFPGAGKALAPRLAIAFGSDRSRWADAGSIQEYSGIAPIPDQSGKKFRVAARKKRPVFLHQTFVEHATHSVGFSVWARAFYAHQRAKGKSHRSAVRSLAFKWQRIMFRCWMEKLPYNEQQYLVILYSKNKSLYLEKITQVVNS